MTTYTIRQLYNIGIISKQLKQVLGLLGCSTFEDLLNLSKDKIKVDYIEKSHHLKDELYRAISDIEDLEEIIPEFTASFASEKSPSKIQVKTPKVKKKRKFKVCDYTESLLMKLDTPISQSDLLNEIKEYLPDTYVESIRANLNGDPKKRFVFFLDGYVGLVGKKYDKRFQPYSIANKKAQYAEQRIMEFLSFMEEKHRSPQPHGLEEEESLYRWYLDFTKSTTKEMAGLRATFQEYLKEYDQWMFTPFEYSYKRNCDQVKWYVDQNMELPASEDEPELASWFNSQLENYRKHKDKRKQMFVELLDFLADYGMRFYDAKSAKGKAAIKEKAKKDSRIAINESPLAKYSRLFESLKSRENSNEYATQKALLIIAIGNLVQSNKLCSNEVMLNNDLLTEFADVCIDNVGTASSYNIAIPYYYMSEEPFWSLIPKEWVVREDREEEEITFDYIERIYACSVIDHDLYELLSSEDDFASLKKILVDNVINSNGLLPSDIIVEEIPQPKPKAATPSCIGETNDNSIIDRFLDFVRCNHNDRTARWYAHTLQNQVREWITKIVGDDTDSVFGFNTIEEVSSCINKLKNSAEFMEENRRKKNVMTAALNKYYLFLQSPFAKSRG
jgi:hypothetical protein